MSNGREKYMASKPFNDDNYNDTFRISLVDRQKAAELLTGITSSYSKIQEVDKI